MGGTEQEQESKVPRCMSPALMWLVVWPFGMSTLALLLHWAFTVWPQRMASAVLTWPAFLLAALAYISSDPLVKSTGELGPRFYLLWCCSTVVFFVLFFLPMYAYRKTGNLPARNLQVVFLIVYLFGVLYYVAVLYAAGGPQEEDAGRRAPRAVVTRKDVSQGLLRPVNGPSREVSAPRTGLPAKASAAAGPAFRRGNRHARGNDFRPRSAIIAAKCC